MNEALTPYPFTAEEPEKNVHTTIKEEFAGLLEMPLFKGVDTEKIMSRFFTHYCMVNMLFTEEEELRKNNTPGANLYYHGRPHAIFQVTRDSITIVKGILQRNDKFSKHLTIEGVLGIIKGGLFHDTGHVSAGRVENYAARTENHVEESKKELARMLRLLSYPKGIDNEKVIRLGQIGIHGTYFPFTPERMKEAREMIDQLPTEERKEAQIVRLTVQLADLGGQCARPDYFPTQIKNLRDELNEYEPGKGTRAIGEEHELEEKKERFINTYVKQPPKFEGTRKGIKVPTRSPNVETTALAFFGEEKSKPFRDAWLR
jgi:hypothetical protein